MVEQVTFQTVFQFLQTVGILVGVFYYVMTIRTNQRNQQLQLETRQLQLYNSAFQPVHNKEWMLAFLDVLYNLEFEDYEDFMSKYSPGSNLEAYSSVILTIELFQRIGLFVEEKALDIDIVTRHMGNTALRLWERVEPFVIGHREKTGDPFHWRSFEYLAQELKKYQQEH